MLNVLCFFCHFLLFSALIADGKLGPFSPPQLLKCLDGVNGGGNVRPLVSPPHRRVVTCSSGSMLRAVWDQTRSDRFNRPLSGIVSTAEKISDTKGFLLFVLHDMNWLYAFSRFESGGALRIDIQESMMTGTNGTNTSLVCTNETENVKLCSSTFRGYDKRKSKIKSSTY